MNKTTKRIDAIVISDINGKILASAEIAYDGVLPKRIIYKWLEEQKTASLEFGQISTTRKFEDSFWQIPNDRKLINMAED